MMATLCSSIIPIIAVSRRPPGELIRHDYLNQRAVALSRWLLPVAAILFLTGGLLLLLPGLSLTISFAGLFLLICALAILTPWVIERICRLGKRVNFPGKGLLMKMVLLNIAAHQRRTSVAVAALSVAVSATLGVALMIDSFRFSVEQWLEGYLRSDIYVSGEGTAAGVLSPVFLDALAGISGVASLATGTRRTLVTNEGPVTLFVLDTDTAGFSGFQYNSLRAGKSISIPTDKGDRKMFIAGVYRDYSSDRGLITISRDTYAKFYDDTRVISAALKLDATVDVESAIADIQQLDQVPEGLFIRSNQSLRETTLTIFDQTFRITEVLRWLAIFVSVIGIVSALMALQLERMREYATLKAIGFSHWQLGGQIVLETGVTGLIAGLMAVPLGFVLAVALIEVINLRSYGWSMQTVIAPELIVQSVSLAVSAALIAGLYPAWHLWKMSVAKGLRNE